jgi:translation initiation factor IF-2
MPVRIYDIAKKLGIESKAVLVKAKELGIPAKVPSSSLDKITAEYLEEQLGGVKPPTPEPAPAAPEIKLVTEAPPPEPPAPAPEPAPVTAPEIAPIVVEAQTIVVEVPPAPAPAPVEAKTEVVPEAKVEPAPAPVVETPAPAPQVQAPPIEEPPAAPPPPPVPTGPKVGEKVGFIQLPPKPAPKVGEKVGSVKLPVKPQQPPGRPDFQRRGGDIRDFRRPGAPGGPQMPGQRFGQRAPEPAKPATPKIVLPENAEVIIIKPPIIVRDLADRLQIKPFKLIADLMGLGVFATVNQSIDEQVAQKVCAKYGKKFEVEKRERGGGIVHAPIKKTVEDEIEDKPETLKPRPPVVTIMGHVDHGKTTLLDVIRKANVAAGESGGITQHIGAYTISFPHPERKDEVQQITFLDTPGHAAFSAMRARGANVTDLVVLVVAANDGVMPQTLEALSHAQAAKVPILVAVNKIDHPNANALKVRQQLQDKGLVPDDWGGDTIFVDVSAITKVGVDKLLEMILLQADLLELKANPERRSKGNVIESGIEPGGPVATVLVRKGTLKVGDVIICGPFYGKARALINEEGQRLKVAGPSVAVRVLGLNGVPEAGLEFTVVEDEKTAREIAAERMLLAKQAAGEARQKVTLENLFATLDATQAKVLKLVVKADTQGSVEAIVDALKKIDSHKVSLEIIHSAVGTVSESDVMLAAASSAIILGFHTRVDSTAAELAKREGIQIKLYSIIYELIDQVKEAMAGLLDPILKENITGQAEVRKVFSLSKGGNVAGCMVSNGRITRGKVRITRRKNAIYEGGISSLRRFQDEVNEVRAGMECGIRIDGFNEFQEGDVIECYALEKIAQKL